MPNPKLESLLRAIIACVGRKTAEPVITWDDTAHCFHVQVNPQDQGRFIGKKGVVIWALKTVFWYAGMAQVTRSVDIDLLEPKDPNDRRPTPFKPNLNWNTSKIETMLNAILSVCLNEPPRYTIEKPEPAEAMITILLNKYLQTPCSDPDLAEALKVLVHAAGMADGCSIKTEVFWQ